MWLWFFLFGENMIFLRVYRKSIKVTDSPADAGDKK